jgi:zinc and cadmium transporter
VQEEHPHHLAAMNLVGDGLHNLLDGIIIAASYLASIPAGIAATLAVVLHEVPQEIGDFGVLVYSGLSRWKALAYNFLSALLAVVGAVIGLAIGSRSETFVSLILPFAAGGFIYIAASDLIPELHKECKCDENSCSGQDRFLRESFLYFLVMLLGLALMYGMTLIE